MSSTKAVWVVFLPMAIALSTASGGCLGTIGESQGADADAATPGDRDGGADAAQEATPDGGVPSRADAATVPTGLQPSADDLPEPDGTCATLVDGTATILGTTVELTVGEGVGPLYLYWHGTGTSASEVERGIPGATDEVSASGGIVASFADTNGTGSNTGNGVWFTGDLDAADQIVACGIAQGLVDPAQIYTAGYSAGGLQVGRMVVDRRYLASAITYSGGLFSAGAGLGDRDYVPTVVTSHGGAGQDVFILDFSETSATFAAAIEAAGGFAIDCDDGGSHVSSSRLGIEDNARGFFADHRFGVQPSPYQAGLPDGWPSFCHLVDNQ